MYPNKGNITTYGKQITKELTEEPTQKDRRDIYDRVKDPKSGV